MGDDTLISVEHLTRRYGSVRAVNDVSFVVRAGEVLGLLGPNGAGKTTTIEVLAGLRSKTSGTVRVLGRDPARGGRRLRNRVGIVLQSAGIDATLTVGEVVRLFASFYRPRRQPAEVIAEVGLEPCTHQRISELSGGQRRRLDLALALVGSPSVLLLDEPTTGLDPAARHQTWRVVEVLRDRGVAILLTSHYLDEVQHLADRVVVLSHGQIVGEGKPGTLMDGTASLSVISFRLADPIVLPAGPWERVESENGTRTLTTREPLEAMRVLANWATSHSLDLEELELHRPSLEEEYLELTGDR